MNKLLKDLLFCFFNLNLFILLEENCFIVFYWFLLYINMNRNYYICPLALESLSSLSAIFSISVLKWNSTLYNFNSAKNVEDEKEKFTSQTWRMLLSYMASVCQEILQDGSEFFRETSAYFSNGILRKEGRWMNAERGCGNFLRLKRLRHKT